MYPYPSGDLHIGHWYIKTPTDALARFRGCTATTCSFPIGFDAFGLPAENAAIKSGGHPREWTMRNIENMRRQFRTMGATFDWEARGRHLPSPTTTAGTSGCSCASWRRASPTAQKSPVDWCPNDGTLAREQVEGADRRCWRCGAGGREARPRPVVPPDDRVRRRAADFAGIDWPGADPVQQTNWIGRSEGAEIVFETAPSDHHAGGEELRVFTTRPDTLFGATFMVLAPEHPLVGDADRARTARRRSRPTSPGRRRTEIERLSTDREKTGVAIGADAINPVNGERIPIFVADYVLAGYGTGAIMAVPAHDERDFAFAEQFGLPIRRVVAAPATRPTTTDDRRLHRPRATTSGW